MTVPTRKEAYAALGLKEPLEWERAVREVNASQGIELQRQKGTTTMLGIEAALDLMHGKVVWVVGYTVTDVERLRKVVDFTLKVLKAPHGTMDGLHMTTWEDYQTTWEDYQGAKRELIGTRPEAVYIDHYLGPTGQEKRPPAGPYGLIRTIEQSAPMSSVWNAKDYDGDFVLALSHEAALTLASEHPERVLMVPAGVSPQLLDPDPQSVSFGTVKAATIKNIPMASNMVVGTDFDWFDCVPVGAGDAVLLLMQDDDQENGIYQITSSGDDGLMFLLPDPTPTIGDSLYVAEGLHHSCTVWTYTGHDWVQVTAGSGSFTVSPGSSMSSTRTATWEAPNGDRMRRVTLPDGSVMVYRNGRLEDVEGAVVEQVDPDDPSLLINILADPD